MSLIATLLAGPTETPPTRAVVSVLPWVDQLLVLDSGLAPDHLAAIRAQAGEQFRHIEFTWPNDFAAARNFALERAVQLGGSWAVTIDTDEELHFPAYQSPVNLLTALNADAIVQTWLVPFCGGQYAKERFIRLPSILHWLGNVHEALTGAAENERVVLPGVFFTEEGKSSEQMAAKLNRDRQALEHLVQADSRNARSWFYLAMTLERQNEGRLAIASYLRCAERSRSPEESAWAHYRAASGMFHYGQYDRALTVCLAGRQQRPIPEIAWLAGFCCYRVGQHSQALEWCRQAIVDAGDPLRAVRGEVPDFKFLPAWFDAPHDLMRQVFFQLGMPRAAEVAAKAQQAAKQARLAAYSKYYPGIEIDDENKPLLPTAAKVQPLTSVSIDLLESLDDPAQ